MAKETVDIIFTKGDHATQPGGLILRRDPETGEWVTHRFNRTPHTRSPREFYWGHYFNGDDAEERARKDFAERKRNLQDPIISEAELIAKGDENLQPQFD